MCEVWHRYAYTHGEGKIVFFTVFARPCFSCSNVSRDDIEGERWGSLVMATYTDRLKLFGMIHGMADKICFAFLKNRIEFFIPGCCFSMSEGQFGIDEIWRQEGSRRANLESLWERKVKFIVAEIGTSMITIKTFYPTLFLGIFTNIQIQTSQNKKSELSHLDNSKREIQIKSS